jgi:putative two-component system response regulator
MEHSVDGMVKPTILVVDDTPDNLALMRELLKDDYQVKLANGGERALALAAQTPHPDLILLDIMMPGMDGYEVCQQLKSRASTQNIPVVFLTAKTAVEDERKGLEMGAVDYITKPISPPIVLARVKIASGPEGTRRLSARQNVTFWRPRCTKRTREVVAIQDVTILAMASLAETRDSDTGNHIRRTQFYVKALASTLSSNPKFSAQLTTVSFCGCSSPRPCTTLARWAFRTAFCSNPAALNPKSSRS